MNCRHFGCKHCRKYVDAGYRWAYWTLEEPGIVALNTAVDVAAVVAREEYWSPPLEELSAWLYSEVLPTVRYFLADHAEHGVLYLDSDFIFDPEREGWGWVELMAENSGDASKHTKITHHRPAASLVLPKPLG